MGYGKIIELFLANGTADSITIAELSNWNGKAIRIPRIEIMDCKREDIEEPGVYFLFCKEEDNTDSVYIGEAENIKERLIQHIRNYSAEKEKYYWTTAIIFIGRDLNKAHIRYLEDRLVTEARRANRYVVLTKNTYSKTAVYLACFKIETTVILRMRKEKRCKCGVSLDCDRLSGVHR